MTYDDWKTRETQSSRVYEDGPQQDFETEQAIQKDKEHQMKATTKLAMLRMQVRSELPNNAIGYANFLTEENYPEINRNPYLSSNLLRLEKLRPGTLAEFRAIMMETEPPSAERQSDPLPWVD